MQTLDGFSVGLGVAVDNALVALVGHVLTDAVLVVGHQDAFSLTSINIILLHDGM